jgi:glycosyltransferase involved in cell wall biosynthesis
MYNDIIIISKNLSFNELREIYSITDCYVSPYTAEGFNLTPLEAAACGTQIVVTNKGSTDDYFNECMGLKIESEEKKINNRYFLNPKIDSLIEILSSTINKPDEKKLIRSKFVHENFSWEKVVKKLKKEFENKLSK